MSFKWTCPYCSHSQVVTEANYDNTDVYLAVGDDEADKKNVLIVAIRCLNADCGRLYLLAELYRSQSRQGYPRKSVGDPLERWALLPDSRHRVVHESVPTAIREDYEEACKIIEKSPKAAATLVRRCLQGMLHDFCNISKKRLIDEVNELISQVKSGVAPREVSIDSAMAIDRVRSIGNIGAHMEADVNLIIDIDVDEANVLIDLVESLFDDWYAARHKRKERFADISRIATEKAAMKNLPPLKSPPSSEPNPLLPQTSPQ